MGLSGIQYLTIYGPKADIDALEASGCELTEEQSRIPYPILEGNNHEVVSKRIYPSQRYRHFVMHSKTPTKDLEGCYYPAKVSRKHDRKLVVKHEFLNSSEYDFYVLLLANYPKCCMVNRVFAEENYEERIMLRFTPRGTIYVDLQNWENGEVQFDKHLDDLRKNVPIKDEITSLDLSYVRYRLLLNGAQKYIDPVVKLFQSIGIPHSLTKHGSTQFRFISKHQSWNPTTYVNILRRRFPHVAIRGEIQDLHGNHIEVIDGTLKGYSFREWKNITKEEERTLNDFSLKK